jgi:hypothetical protein
MPDSRGAGSGCPAVLVFKVKFLTDKVFGSGGIPGKEEHSSKGEKKKEFCGHW